VGGRDALHERERDVAASIVKREERGPCRGQGGRGGARARRGHAIDVEWYVHGHDRWTFESRRRLARPQAAPRDLNSRVPSSVSWKRDEPRVSRPTMTAQALEQGIALYVAGRFWDAHEAWEEA